MRKRRNCILAVEANQCGPASLATVAEHYGKTINVAQLSEMCETDLQGTDLYSLKCAAESIGFSASCGRAKPDALDKMPVPAIVHCGRASRGHIVVLHKVSKKHILVADPARGVLRVSRDDFLKDWSRHVILLVPGETFRRDSRRTRNNEYTRLIALYLSPTMILICLAAAISAFTLGLARIAQAATESVLSHSFEERVSPLALFAALLLGSRLCVTLLRGRILARLGELIEAKLFDRYTSKLFRLPIQYFEQRTAGDIFARIPDVLNVRAAYTNALLSTALDALTVLVCALLLSTHNVGLAAILAVPMPLMLIFYGLTYSKISHLQRSVSEHLSKLAGALIEAVQSMRIVKCFGTEDHVLARVRNIQQQLNKSTSDRANLASTVASISSFITGASSCAVLLLGSSEVVHRSLSLGRLFFFYAVAGVLLGAIERLPPSLLSIQDGRLALQRLESVDTTPDETNEKAPKVIPSFKPLHIVVSHVGFWHRSSQPVLRDISFEVTGGTTIAIVGETGCGKSTLAQLLCGLYLPKEGLLSVGGVSIEKLDRMAYRKAIATVFQEPYLFSGTIRENITMGRAASVEDIMFATQAAHAHEFITMLPKAYDYDVGAGGVALSTGQRQRIALARALVLQPVVLMMDEATSSLDVHTEAKVLASVLDLRRGLTNIIVTHRLSTASKADTILVLDGGRIKECGTHEKLVEEQGLYCAMWSEHLTATRAANNIMTGATRSYEESAYM